MMTRRTVLGAGMTFASVAYTAGFSAYGHALQLSPEARFIDALLIDNSIEIPRQLAAFIKANSQTLPAVAIQLDAAAHTELMRILSKSQAIIGISSGATLFCLERIAWDHGFRLTGRIQRCTSDLNDNACQQDVAAFLSNAQPVAGPSLLARAYRPSRADGKLHAWVMQKSASSYLHQTRREV